MLRDAVGQWLPALIVVPAALIVAGLPVVLSSAPPSRRQYWRRVSWGIVGLAGLPALVAAVLFWFIGAPVIAAALVLGIAAGLLRGLGQLPAMVYVLGFLALVALTSPAASADQTGAEWARMILFGLSTLAALLSITKLGRIVGVAARTKDERSNTAPRIGHARGRAAGG